MQEACARGQLCGWSMLLQKKKNERKEKNPDSQMGRWRMDMVLPPHLTSFLLSYDLMPSPSIPLGTHPSALAQRQTANSIRKSISRCFFTNPFFFAFCCRKKSCRSSKVSQQIQDKCSHDTDAASVPSRCLCGDCWWCIVLPWRIGRLPHQAV